MILSLSTTSMVRNKIFILSSYLRLIAESRTQGMFVAPRTKMPSLSTPTPALK